MSSLRSTLADLVSLADSLSLRRASESAASAAAAAAAGGASSSHLSFTAFKILWRSSPLPLALCALVCNGAGTWRSEAGEALHAGKHAMELRAMARWEMEQLFSMLLHWLERAWEGVPTDEEAAVLASAAAAAGASAAAAAGPMEWLAPELQARDRQPQIARCVYIVYALYTLWATQQREPDDTPQLRHPVLSFAQQLQQAHDEAEVQARNRLPAVRIKKEKAEAAAGKRKKQREQRYKKAVMAGDEEEVAAADARAAASAAAAFIAAASAPAIAQPAAFAPPIPIPLPQRCWSLLESMLHDFRSRSETREAAHVLAKLFADSAFEFVADEQREERPYWSTRSQGSLWYRQGDLEAEARERERRAAAVNKRAPDHSDHWDVLPQHAPTVRVRSLADRSWRHDFRAELTALQESEFMRANIATSVFGAPSNANQQATVTVPLLDHLSSEKMLNDTVPLAVINAKMKPYNAHMASLQSVLPMQLRSDVATETSASRLFGPNRGAAAVSLQSTQLIAFSKLRPSAAAPISPPPNRLPRPPGLFVAPQWLRDAEDDDDDDEESTSDLAADAAPLGPSAGVDDELESLCRLLSDDDRAQWRRLHALQLNPSAPLRHQSAHSPGSDAAVHKDAVTSAAAAADAADDEEADDAGDAPMGSLFAELCKETIEMFEADDTEYKQRERQMRAQSVRTQRTRLHTVHAASQQRFSSLVSSHRLADSLQRELNKYAGKLVSQRHNHRVPMTTRVGQQAMTPMEFRRQEELAKTQRFGGTSHTARAKQAAAAAASERTKMGFAAAAAAPLTLPPLPPRPRDFNAFHDLAQQFAQSVQQRQDERLAQRLAMVQAQLMPEEEMQTMREQVVEYADDADHADAADEDAEDQRSYAAAAPPPLSQLSFFANDGSNTILHTPQSMAPMMAPQRALSNMQLESQDQDGYDQDHEADGGADQERKQNTEEATNIIPAPISVVAAADAAAADLLATKKSRKKPAAKPRSKKGQTQAAVSTAAIIAAAAVANAADPSAPPSREVRNIGLGDEDERKEPEPAAAAAAAAAAPASRRKPRRAPPPPAPALLFSETSKMREDEQQLDAYIASVTAPSAVASQPHATHKRQRKDAASHAARRQESESKEDSASAAAADGEFSIAASTSIQADGSQRQTIPRKKARGAAAAAARVPELPNDVTARILESQHGLSLEPSFLHSSSLHPEPVVAPSTPALSVATPRSVQSAGAAGGAVMRPFSLDGHSSFLVQSGSGSGALASQPLPPVAAASRKRHGGTAVPIPAPQQKKQRKSNKKAAAADAEPAAAASAASATAATAPLSRALVPAPDVVVDTPMTATSALVHRSVSGFSHASGRSVSLGGGRDDDTLSEGFADNFSVDFDDATSVDQQAQPHHTAPEPAAPAVTPVAAAATAAAAAAAAVDQPKSKSKRKRGPNKPKAAAASAAAAVAAQPKPKGRPTKAQKAREATAAAAAAAQRNSEFAEESSEDFRRRFADIFDAEL